MSGDVHLTPFDCVSPLDFRYYGTSRSLFKKLAPFVSERARVAYELKVEVALVEILAARRLCSAAVAEEVRNAAETVTAEEVAAEEERIQHNVRALVNCLRQKVSDEAKPFIHFGMTSFDVIDTATALRFKQLTETVLLPDLLRLEANLISLAMREKGTVQMGRTHGQHAVPITFGFAMAEYVSRFGNRIEAIRAASDNLRGKVSGAVGAYNALSLLVDDPEQLEKDLLARLGLKPSTHSTQIVEAEYLLDYVHALVSALGVLANLADDLRHLQRTEIGEVGEVFEAAQVGSSTMPQKRNPINFENVKSMWKAFFPRIMTSYADQISEHQRDLTNSASQRFVPEVAVALESCVERLNRVIPRLVVDRQNMARNLKMTGDLAIAEAFYIVLAASGHPDAHEAVRRLTLEAERSGESLYAIASRDAELRPYLERLSPHRADVLKAPERYLGIAEKKTEEVCREWAARLRLPPQ
jgi:adenylosuccinate lyase